MSDVSESPSRSLETLDLDRLHIAYFEGGTGPTVILCHCSSASHREWLPLIQILTADSAPTGGWHVLAPDFIGYGHSDSWPVDKPFSVDGDVQVLLALADAGNKTIHLVGHSYGAALALEAAFRLGSRVKSLSLVEPVSFHLLRHAERPEWHEIEQLGVKVLSAVAKGDDRKAAANFMTYWLGWPRWFLAPEQFKLAIAATIPKVALEFNVAIDAPTTLGDYAKVHAPTLLIVGGKTRRPARTVSDMLRAVLPHARLAVIRRAGHMSPFTHPAEINRLIADHLSAHR